MSNTIQIKSGNSAPSNKTLLEKELGFDFGNGDLYIGKSDGTPLLVAKSSIMSKLKIQSGNLVLDGKVLATNIDVDSATFDKIIVNSTSRGTSDPSGTGEDGQLYFKII